MMTENRREPGGATQTLVPRPRPAICVEAVKVKPVGSLVLIFGFLNILVLAFVVGYIWMDKGGKGCTSPGVCLCSSPHLHIIRHHPIDPL